MTSKIDIISNAYFQLGKGHITALNQNSDLDMGASKIYDQLIPAILSTFDYNFARKFEELNKNAAAPTDDNYTSSFNLPNDYISLVGFKEGTETFNYKIMGTDIWANTDELSINYIYEPVTSMFPPQFVLYLIYEMCAHLAFPISNQFKLAEYWEKKALSYQSIAIASISSQEPARIIDSQPLINAFVG